MSAGSVSPEILDQERRAYRCLAQGLFQRPWAPITNREREVDPWKI